MCTGIQFITEDGTAIVGRTLEFSTEIGGEMLFVPAGIHRSSPPSEPSPVASTWMTKYAAVGMNAAAVGYDCIFDGINSEGLSVSMFYFIGYSDVTAHNPENPTHLVDIVHLNEFMLSMFKDCDEVKNELPKIKVFAEAQAFLGGVVAPLHFRICDQRGGDIVVEYTNPAGLEIHDNHAHVFTNSPAFQWHITNLRNYLSVANVNGNLKGLPGNQIDEKLNLNPFSAGHGCHPLPGGITPPDRFIRAFFYRNFTPSLPTATDAVRKTVTILNNFDIPIGSALTTTPTATYCGQTHWTSVHDLKDLVYYFHTATDHGLRKVNLKDLQYGTDIIHIGLSNEEPRDITKTGVVGPVSKLLPAVDVSGGRVGVNNLQKVEYA